MLAINAYEIITHEFLSVNIYTELYTTLLISFKFDAL